MIKKSQETMGDTHSHCTDPHHDHHGHDHHDMKHDAHALLHPAHSAFEELLKERIKEQLSSDPKMNETIEKLASMGTDFIGSHIDTLVDDITNSFEKNENHH